MTRTLAELPYKEKDEILDWTCIPAGSCDMNFRPASAHPTGDIREVVVLLVQVATIAGFFGLALRYLIGPFMTSWISLGLAVGIGTVLALADLWAGSQLWPNPFAQLPRRWPSAVLFGLPLILWLVAAWLSRPMPVLGPFSLLMMVGVPALFLAADLMTTQAVHWMSAHPRVPGRTMRRWRILWQQRFQDALEDSAETQSPETSGSHMAAAKRLHNNYSIGFVLVSASLGGPALVALACDASGTEHPLGAMIVIGQISSLFLVAVARTPRLRVATRLVAEMLEHWHRYERDRLYPPWVFQSPIGSQPTRTLLMGAAIASMSIAIVPLFLVEVTLPAPAQGSGDGFSALSANWDAFCQYHFAPLLESTVDGNFAPLMQMLLLPFVAILVSVACWLFAVYIVAAPALLVHYDALEAPNAPEQERGQSRTDGYANRLADSTNRIERNSIMLGYHPTTEYPILLDTELLREHMHILGATGSGKTALGLSTLVPQLIRRGDGAVIVLDCKGDPAFFNTVRIEASRAGRPFKWFTNRLHRSTYVFNPFTQKHLEDLTLPEYVGLFMSALNLHHGEDYGRAWFSAASRTLFQRALERLISQTKQFHAPIDSFRQLEETMRHLSSDEYEYRAALHLAFIVKSLSQFRQLNLSPRSDGNHPALDHAIHMPDVIRQQQVVYFSLVAATDISSVAQIAKLVVYSALCAAMAHRDRYGERPKVYLVCDEAQTIIAQNIQNVLAQAREHGLACILAHQTMSQLNPPGGVDLRELVLNCTCVKQFFTARDKISKDYISNLSGHVGYYVPSWSQTATDVLAGRVSPAYAVAPADRAVMFGIRPEVGPRLTHEDIADISRHHNANIVAIEQNTGYSAFLGAFPVHTEWPLSKREYDRRHLDMRWPSGTEATIELSRYWPGTNDETIVPTLHPPLEGPGDDQKTLERLREIKRRLDME